MHNTNDDDRPPRQTSDHATWDDPRDAKPSHATATWEAPTREERVLRGHDGTEPNRMRHRDTDLDGTEHKMPTTRSD